MSVGSKAPQSGTATNQHASADLDGQGPGRWLVSLGLVLGLHALALPWLMSRADQAPPPPPAALQLDLPPPPAPAPPEPPKPEPPKPEPPKPVPPKPTPPKPVVVRPVTPPLPAPPVPSPVAAPTPQPPAPSSAPVQSEAPAVQNPPAPPAPALKGPDTFEGRLLAQLYKYKRYPAAARTRHQTGTAMLRFTMDRSGHVLSASLERSSGASALDEETLALVRRAEPLPAMPDEMPGATLELVVPVEFSLN
ncbi:MAG: energy transducer TonB [Azospirillaceae bacterium]|nr:energy transducer TonB [Azospirillaceae bacterium]